MSEPIRIPLSAFQVAQLSELRDRAVALATEERIVWRTLIGGHVDPATVRQHALTIDGDAIVLTPPAEG